MKKFKTLLISSMIGAMVFGMSGCKASTTDTIAPHTHAYDDGVVTTPATCTEDGVMTFTCECGDTYTEVITALGHNFSEWTVTNPATCTEEGEETRTCETCGVTETRPVPTTEHSYESKHTVATLDTPAFDTFTCSECNDTKTDNEDLWTARDVVQAFANEVFEDPSKSVREATLQDGTEVRYTAANFVTNLGTPSDAINVVMNVIFADLDGLDLYQGSTSDGDNGYYALYTYESDYTFLVVEVDSYLSSTNTIIQVMSYLEDAR